MRPLHPANADRVLGEAQGFQGLPVFDLKLADGTPALASFWELDDDEKMRLDRGAPIQLTIQGTGHPPVMLEVGEEPEPEPWHPPPESSWPWRYRPQGRDDMGWEDNWLSNSMAWVSDTFLKGWCDAGPTKADHDDHWTIKVANYFWAECSCCLTFRMFAFGALVGGAVVGALWATVAAIW